MIYQLSIIWIAFKSSYGFLDWASYLFIKVINPFFEMLFYIYLAIFTGSNNRLAEVVIGNAMLLCSFGAIGDVGMIYIRERYNGTLKVLLASSKLHIFIFMKKTIFHVLDAFFTTLLGLCIGYFIFHIPLLDYPILPILCSIIFSMFACVALGFLLGSVGLLLSDINLISNCLLMSMRFLCGAMIALNQLPIFFQKLAYCFPITRGLEAIQLLIDGKTWIHIVPLLFFEFLLGLCFFMVSFVIFHMIEKIAKKNATLELL